MREMTMTGRVIGMGKTIICASCNGCYEDELPKCPYCGSTNIKGAEKEYMEKLEDVRGKMEGLEEVPAETLQAVLKKQGRKLWIVILAIGILALLFFTVLFFTERTEDTDFKEEYLWKQEHYPELNELFDSGRYDEMEELFYKLGEDEASNLFDWEHYEFMNAYIAGKSVLYYLESEKEKPLNEYNLIFLFDNQWEMKGIVLRKDEFTEPEYEALLPFIEISEADFESRWKLTEEEYENFYSSLAANEGKYVPFDDVKTFIKEWVKESR